MKTNTHFHSLALIIAATAVLLPSAINSCLAQLPTPSVAVPSPVGVSWHKLSLLNAVPSDILTTMHWNAPAQLPPGVTKVYALEADRSLFIQATPDGYSRVSDIVQNLDVKPRAVEIKVDWVTADNADIANFRYMRKSFPPNTIGSIPLIGIAPWDRDEQFFAALKKCGDATFTASTVSTTSDIPVTITASGLTSPANVHPSIEITPRVNANHTMTISIVEPIGIRTNHTDTIVEQQGVNSQTLPTLHTLTNKRISLLEDLPWDNERRLLIFITPTLLPDASADSKTLATPSEGVHP